MIVAQIVNVRNSKSDWMGWLSPVEDGQLLNASKTEIRWEMCQRLLAWHMTQYMTRCCTNRNNNIQYYYSTHKDIHSGA